MQHVSCTMRNVIETAWWETYFHVPKSQISLSCFIRKMLHVKNLNPFILGNKVKFNTFFIPWSKSLCCGANLLQVASRNYQAAETWGHLTAQMNQAAMLDFLSLWGGPQDTHRDIFFPVLLINNSMCKVHIITCTRVHLINNWHISSRNKK